MRGTSQRLVVECYGRAFPPALRLEAEAEVQLVAAQFDDLTLIALDLHPI